MTHYTRKGYAYTGASLIPQGCVKISFADYLLSGPIRILNTRFCPTMSCTTALTPIGAQFRCYAFAQTASRPRNCVCKDTNKRAQYKTKRQFSFHSHIFASSFTVSRKSKVDGNRLLSSVPSDRKCRTLL